MRSGAGNVGSLENGKLADCVLSDDPLSVSND
jgi:imidazolonepropionase-like amidohydrolase